jgi:3'(2'), 5'-bisphosphate nucleotidase
MTELGRVAEIALSIGLEAAEVVKRVYAAPFEVEFKSKDDPVTRADREANELACEQLARAFPGVPIVAEESDPREYAGFTKHDRVWFVDPLDGTREFVAKNGEFAVMLGLAEGGRAIVGAIVAPAWERAFVGIVGEGAWEISKNGTRVPIHVSTQESISDASFVVSRSRAVERAMRLAAVVGASKVVPHGSSGLKGVLVANGVYDVYVQPGNAGMRWDACATEALVRAAGGACTQEDGSTFDYADGELHNRRGLIATNGRLHQAVVEAIRKA